MVGEWKAALFPDTLISSWPTFLSPWWAIWCQPASVRWRFFLGICEMERKIFSQIRTWPPSQHPPISPSVSWFFLLSFFKLFIAYLSLPSSKSWVVSIHMIYFFPSFSKYFLPIAFLSQPKCFLSANIFLIVSPHPSPNTFFPAIFLGYTAHDWKISVGRTYTLHNVYFVKYIFPRNRTSSNLS